MTTTTGVRHKVEKSRQQRGESKFCSFADVLYDCAGVVIITVILLLLFQANLLGESVPETIKDHNPH